MTRNTKDRFGILMLVMLIFTFFSNVAVAQGTIYKIQNKYGSGFLIGSAHKGTMSLYPFDSRLEKIIRMSTLLTTEISMEQTDAYRTLLSNGLKLSEEEEKNIPVDLFNEAISILKTQGFPDAVLEQLHHFHPFVTYQLVATKVSSKGYFILPGTEAYLVTLADRYELKKSDLEDPQNLIAAIQSLNTDEMTILLKTVITLFNDSQIRAKNYEQIDHMSALVKRGDYTSAKRSDQIFMSKHFGWRKSIFDKLYQSRNQGLADQLIQHLNQNEVFVAAIGASHLPGDGGVLDLLIKSGCKVRIYKN